MNFDDTILATSSPSGHGLRAIIRLSGPDAWALARAVTSLPPDAAAGCHAPLTLTVLPSPIALAAVLLFRAPRSFTGQDIAELHIPNSPALIGAVIDHLLASRPASVRLANPGEFSARAFFNGKIDLTRAEGIAATINARNSSQLRAAASLRSGDLHRWTAAAADRLANLLALIEAGIDFADEEDIRFIDPSQIADQLADLRRDIDAQLSSSHRLAHPDHPPTAVFIGRPNVGKSSLINALAGHDRSIVSHIAGTTRDILSAVMHTPHGDIRLLDVPGEEPPTDELREKMMAARDQALLEADLIVEVVADLTQSPSSATAGAVDAAPRLRIQNKADLLPAETVSPADCLRVSAKTGLHIPDLRAAIRRQLLEQLPAAPGRIELNHRHRAILRETGDALTAAADLAPTADQHPELLAGELRRALDLLGQITGAISPDEVLGRIFSQFCLGK